MQKAVPALYSLQAALINSLPPSRDSDAILNQFKSARQQLQIEWNRSKELLQRSRGYSEIYDLYATGSNSLDLAKCLPPKAHEACKKATDVKEKYEKLHKELQVYGDKVSAFTPISTM